MRFYTIGYGGRLPPEFLALLTEHRVRTVADIRIRPQRARMGSYVLAKSADKGIQRLLASAGIGYAWVEELGNPYRHEADWMAKYRQLMATQGEKRVERLLGLPEPLCLVCSEKKAEECHRVCVSEVLISLGHELVAHI